MSPNAKEGDLTTWHNILKALSANDCCFSSPVLHNGMAASGQSQFFMPFFQAITPGVWKKIATWLAADSQRSLRVKIGKAELEVSSLLELIELLSEALLIYGSGQITNADKSSLD